MTWVEDELGRQREEDLEHEAQRLKALREADLETARKALAEQQKVIDRQRENELTVSRYRQMLTERDVTGLLQEVQRITGGHVVHQEGSLPYSGHYAASALINVSFGETTFHEGGGYTRRWTGTGGSREDAGYYSGGSEYVKRFRHYLTPFELWVLGVGFAGGSSNSEMYLIAKKGTRTLKHNLLKPGVFERFMTNIGKAGDVSKVPYYLVGEDRGHLFQDYYFDRKPVQHVTNDGAIDLNTVNLFPDKSLGIVPTSNAAKDRSGLQNLMIEGLRIIQPHQNNPS